MNTRQGLLLATLLATPAHAETYLVDFTTNNNVKARVTGQIVTTCNNCPLNASDITSWFFLADGAHQVSSTDADSSISLVGGAGVTPSSPLFATPDNITFDPTKVPQSSTLEFGFPGEPNFTGVPVLVFDAEPTSFLYDIQIDSMGRVGELADSLGQASLEIATRAPEASTWAMMLIGFVGLALMSARRRWAT